MPPRASTWVIWSWVAGHETWMEVGQGTERDMRKDLARKQAAAARHLPSARFTVTPLGYPPQEPPEGQETGS